jgi:hypothetical protein
MAWRPNEPLTSRGRHRSRQPDLVLREQISNTLRVTRVNGKNVRPTIAASGAGDCSENSDPE